LLTARAASKSNSVAGTNPTHAPRASGASSINVWKPGKNKLPRLSSKSGAISIEHIKVNEGFAVGHPAKKKK
jgi:hypothetical protein